MVAVEIINAVTTYTNIPDLLDTAITVLVLLYFLSTQPGTNTF